MVTVSSLKFSSWNVQGGPELPKQSCTLLSGFSLFKWSWLLSSSRRFFHFPSVIPFDHKSWDLLNWLLFGEQCFCWLWAVSKMKVCKALILGHPPDHLGRFRDSTLTLISDWSFPTTIAKFTTITWLGLPCTNLVTQCPSHCHKNALWQLCLLTELYFMKSSISDLFISPNT